MTVKQRLELKSNTEQNAQTLAEATAPASPVVVVAESSGPVSFWDKAKNYYKTLISIVGLVLVVLNEITPMTSFLPENQRHWLSVAVVAVTALLTFLKSNETWFDSL